MLMHVQKIIMLDLFMLVSVYDVSRWYCTTDYKGLCILWDAQSCRRIVMGLREVTKHLKLNQLKCIIISPNMERIQSKGIFWFVFFRFIFNFSDSDCHWIEWTSVCLRWICCYFKI